MIHKSWLVIQAGDGVKGVTQYGPVCFSKSEISLEVIRSM